MSYIYPSAVINFITYTAKRWGQFPTISYITGGTAGSEVVILNDNPAALPSITVKIASGVSTNAQIATAIANAKDIAMEGLYASDLIDVVITGGHESDTNTAISPTPLTGAINGPTPEMRSASLPQSGVVAGSYTSANITVSADGRIIVAANGSGGGGVTYPLLAPDGSIAAPSYSFSSELGTGLSYNAGGIYVSTGGIMVATISSDGFDAVTGVFTSDIPGSIAAPIFALGNGSGIYQPNGTALAIAINGTDQAAQFDASATAGDTRLLLWDVDNATLARVTVGVADSGGAGYKVLRVPN